MWARILDHMLAGFITTGTLHVTYFDGQTRRYGDRAATPVAITLETRDLARRLVLSTELAVGEAYMDGALTIENDDLDAFLELVIRNASKSDRLWWRKSALTLRRARRKIDQWNPAPRARRNVAHHYDLSPELYDLFLDRDRQYSCAYFKTPSDTLEEAQDAKKRHIAAKLLLEPGMKVFEIGCGWGGLGLTLARDYGARVTGVTLSEEQHRYATRRAAEAGLSDRVHYELRDYRTVEGQFDRIVSVGMFEHVGLPHFREYFSKLRERLSEDGVALIHTIGRPAPPGATSPWITKYIFPGGYVPSLSELCGAMEREALYPTDLEIWRVHYAQTLRHWHDRFRQREAEARALYDERFCKMWRYYLKASEHTFRHGRQCVFQLQLARKQDAVPLTRDYLYPAASHGDQLRAAE